MGDYDISSDVITIKNADFNVATLKPEYVLKVNNIPESISTAKVFPSKSNPNPDNLPAIRKTRTSKAKTVFLYVTFFLFIFIVAAVIGYKTVFYLFTI